MTKWFFVKLDPGMHLQKCLYMRANLFLKFKLFFFQSALGASPQIKRFFLAVYTDPFLSRPIQIWQVFSHALQRVDVACVEGQTSRFSLLLRWVFVREMNSLNQFFFYQCKSYCPLLALTTDRDYLMSMQIYWLVPVSFEQTEVIGAVNPFFFNYCTEGTGKNMILLRQRSNWGFQISCLT